MGLVCNLVRKDVWADPNGYATLTMECKKYVNQWARF